MTLRRISGGQHLLELAAGRRLGGEKIKELKIMRYKLIGFKGKRELGPLRDHKGEILVFQTEEAAITTAQTESMQMENTGVRFEIVPIE